MDQDSEYFSPVKDFTSSAQFGLFTKDQPEDVRSTNQLVVHLIPTENILFQQPKWKTSCMSLGKAAVCASMCKGTPNDDELLNADNFREVACSKDTGD